MTGGFDGLLKRIEGQMTECAQEALARPQGRDAFEYGRMSGMYAGLSVARDLLLQMKDEEDERNI